MENFVLSAAQRVIIIMLFMLNINSLSAQSQSKVEVEKRISASEIPAPVTQLLQPLLLSSKNIKYYKEFSRNDTTYEVKLKHNINQLSIEFNNDGTFQDIEKKVKFSDLKTDVKEKIEATFGTKFIKYRVTRCQIQYTKTDKSQKPIELYLKNEHKKMNVLYEIEAKVKKNDGQIQRMEFLFDKNGKIIKSRRIDEPQDDFLLY